ncbi:mannitol dehydrogenase family protein [Oricola sp.]|uniref:mannitol dehydrogenase family protein n=1 Tax=Oricola sp. TaxID=1979950 RepID=UPI0025D16282|nr:mannitol dehydrogenase family protein [Oricola sp.]MCI5077963.1 mannitol dehydrogenase family protein [Oricola sp.]
MTDLPRLARPADAPAPGIGIVHLGLGAFFRAHGALYIEEAMARSGGDWGILGVSLRHADLRDRLEPQDYAYTACELGPEGESLRIGTAVRSMLVAPEDPDAVLAAMADPGVTIVSLTVTEKGYCHAPATGRLDFAHPDIVRDLADAARPVSAPGFLCRALDRRRKAGLRPFTVMSCDNLPENGALLQGVVLDLAARMDAELARWIEAECVFPCTMVDRIAPATTDADIERLARRTGIHDAAPVMHEPFRQWVIEDRFVDGRRPALEAVGVELVEDVRPFEHMKLRCLNGTHSALAYLGYLAGAETVSDAVARPALAGFIRRLWDDEILPVLTPPPGVDLAAYTHALTERYANPGIRHRTWQIAMDGSLKLPQRILGSVSENLAAGRTPRGLFLVIAAWMRYTSGVGEDGQPIDVRDPMADRLRAVWQDGAEPAAIVSGYLAFDEIFPGALAADPAFSAGLTEALADLLRDGAEVAAAQYA